MHFILTAFGSYGDVLPMVGLGATMRDRGHRVQVIVNPYFQGVVEGAGLEMLPLGTADEYRELMQHPDLWHPQRGLTLVLTRGAAHYLEEVYSILESQVTPGDTVLAAHGLDMASRIYHEKHAAPLATVHFAPMALMTLYETARYMGVPNMAKWPRWAKRGMFWAGDKWKIDPLIGPAVNKLRQRHGLPSVSRIFTQYNNSPQLVLGLFPDWFGPMQPDWPAHTAVVGFPLWDPPAATELNAEVDQFLRAGEPPIVFAPGSANVQAHEFFQTAADVCAQLGRRGMLMTKYPDQLPARLPAGVGAFGFVPFSQLLPRAAALVHHGGIGTCGQGLAAALPQVVMPQAYDQLDNGTRLARLGVGAVIPVEKFKLTRVAATLAELLGSDDVRERCRDLASRCDGRSSLDAASDLLERLHERRGERVR